MRRSTEVVSISLAGTIASSLQRRAASIVGAVVLLSTFVGLLVGGTHLPPLPAVASVLIAVPLFFWAICAYLIYSQAIVVRSRPLLILSTACGLAAFLDVPFLLAFPGILSTRGLFGTESTAPWLWWLSHLAFALLVVAYARAQQGPLRTWRRGEERRYAAGVIAVFLALTVLAALPGLLPPLAVDGQFTPANQSGASLLLALVSIVSLLYCAAATRMRTVLDLWLVVTMIALGCEVAVSSASGARYTLGWYLAHFDYMLAAATLLVVFLNDFTMLSRRLALLAAVDAVSGLANRRALDERLDVYVGNRRRRGDTLSVIMIDIDHFKAFNDRYGHTAGDECLRSVGEIIRRALVRAGDFAARYGGEEFVVVLPATNRKGALVVAERIRADVERLAVVGKRSTTPVTVSLGVVTVPPHAVASAEAVLHAADRAMYAAKAGGRNCIVDASEALTGLGAVLA